MPSIWLSIIDTNEWQLTKNIWPFTSFGSRFSIYIKKKMFCFSWKMWAHMKWWTILSYETKRDYMVTMNWERSDWRRYAVGVGRLRHHFVSLWASRCHSSSLDKLTFLRLYITTKLTIYSILLLILIYFSKRVSFDLFSLTIFW